MTKLYPLEPAPLPVKLGTVVDPWGAVSAVGLTGGERYYWLTKGGGVSMLPWFVVEGAVRDAKHAHCPFARRPAST